jgi:hypothetical protein
MAGTIELPFFFSPWYRAAQVGAALPYGKKSTILQPRDVKSPYGNMAHCAGYKFFYSPGVYYAAKRSRLAPRFKKFE